MLEYGLRFLAGGIAVSAFTALGDSLRPKSFAGLFGAAASIALATLLITLSQKGAPFVAMESRSMIVGLRAGPAAAGQIIRDPVLPNGAVDQCLRSLQLGPDPESIAELGSKVGRVRPAAPSPFGTPAHTQKPGTSEYLSGDRAYCIAHGERARGRKSSPAEGAIAKADPRGQGAKGRPESRPPRAHSLTAYAFSCPRFTASFASPNA